MPTDQNVSAQLFGEFRDQNRRSLSELSDAAPVLLIFLRHMG
jgi:hypothetical protein